MEASVLFKEAPVALPDIAALTDGCGWVVLAAPTSGSYTLEAAAAGFQSATVVLDVGARDEELIEMVLTPSADRN